MIINIIFLLDELSHGEDFIFFKFPYIIFRGWGRSPILLDISTSKYHIYMFLYCFTDVCQCIHVMYKFKGKYAE